MKQECLGKNENLQTNRQNIFVIKKTGPELYIYLNYS